MPKTLTWREAAKEAIKKVVERHNDPEFSRQILIDEEMDYIKKMTRTKGKTPEQTLSRTLQELWKEENYLSHEERGIYQLIQLDNVNLQTVDITDNDVGEGAKKALYKTEIKMEFENSYKGNLECKKNKIIPGETKKIEFSKEPV
ncbi:MAG: hypothetical protein ACQESD_03605 [Thermoplasmatota archaeon]